MGKWSWAIGHGQLVMGNWSWAIGHGSWPLTNGQRQLLWDLGDHNLYPMSPRRMLSNVSLLYRKVIVY